MRPAPAILAALMALSGAAHARDCPSAPDPVLTLDFASRYTDGDPTRSTLDPEAEAAAEAALAPLDDFLRDLADSTEAMLKADPAARRSLADCILARIGTWAEADALAVLATDTVALTIASRLAAFGLVTRAVQAEGAEDPAVSAWLQRRMREQMRFWETAPDGAASGNLRAWAGLAGAAIAGLAGDPVMRGWAAWSVGYVMCSAAPDGSLPREMERGARALHYQLYALAPLVTATALLEGDGLPVRDACPGALDRAVRFALEDLDTGARTEALTGQVQTLHDGTDPLEDFQLAWIEAYLVLDADPRVQALAETHAAPRRPLSFSKLGGNQSLFWGQGGI